MSTVLLGGFDPFADYRENPSWDVAQALAEQCRTEFGGRVRFVSVRLPVAFDAGAAALAEALIREAPAAVLLCGLHGQNPFLDFEQFGLNAGQQEKAHDPAETPFPLGEAGPAARETTVALPPLVRRLREAGIPARISFHAGTFLCNASYYQLLDWARSHDPPRKALFVHIPLLPDQAARHFEATREALPSMDIDRVTRGLRLAVDSLLGP